MSARRPSLGFGGGAAAMIGDARMRASPSAGGNAAASIPASLLKNISVLNTLQESQRHKRRRAETARIIRAVSITVIRARPGPLRASPLTLAGHPVRRRSRVFTKPPPVGEVSAKPPEGGVIGQWPDSRSTVLKLPHRSLRDRLLHRGKPDTNPDQTRTCRARGAGSSGRSWRSGRRGRRGSSCGRRRCRGTRRGWCWG